MPTRAAFAVAAALTLAACGASTPQGKPTPPGDAPGGRLAAGSSAIDPNAGVVGQLCADAGRLDGLIDAARGVSHVHIWEGTPDDNPGGESEGTVRGAEAAATLRKLFGGDLWCFAGYEGEAVVPGTRDCMGGDEVEDPMLAQVKGDVLCLHRDQCGEWATQGDLCLVRDTAGWRLAFIAQYPTGPLDPEYIAGIQARVAAAQKAALAAFGK